MSSSKHCALPESGTQPDQLDYFMVLKESPPPPPPPDPLGVWTRVSSTRPVIFSTRSPGHWMLSMAWGAYPTLGTRLAP